MLIRTLWDPLPARCEPVLDSATRFMAEKIEIYRNMQTSLRRVEGVHDDVFIQRMWQARNPLLRRPSHVKFHVAISKDA